MSEEKQKKPFYKRWWFFVIIGVVVIGMVGQTDDYVADDEDEDNGNGEEVAEADADATEEEDIDEEADVEATEEEEPEVHDIDFDPTIDIGEEEVVIEGETNFDDGTNLDYQIVNNDDIDEMLDGDLEVEDGTFSENINIEDLSVGEIEVVFGYYPFNQSEEITETYGEEGQFIENDDIDEYGEIRVVETAVNATPIELNGSGDVATETFDLQPGFAVIDANHQGEANFIVELKDESGDQELLVNEIGNYDGETFALIPGEGEYHFDIDADGAWEAEVTQTMPGDDDIESEDEQIEGSGDSVIFVDMESGNKRFEFTHDGEANFIVLLNGMDLLVNDIGSYEGSQSQNLADDDVYVFEIQADGSWTIEIE
ncbi:hypothetical protein [Natribacillus halophilus]|uniref:Uncharacterized protein n=1 Tax=Natribacillus halophilus TaxID=549003 RepID=A0A1G8M9G3_9BACI|nr:hypothetical protein [Natribacillus halophilus]SDI64515.1 hypothetical protein SAMN04488123_10443 [Natribacillus halophilus]